MSNYKEKINELDDCINGNGKTGLKGDVIDLKSKMSLIGFVAAALVTSIIGALVASIWALMKGR